MAKGRGLRWLRRILVLVRLALLAGVFALLAAQRTEVAGFVATRLLRQAGFPDAAVSVDALELEHSRLTVRLDAGGQTGGTLALDHPLDSLKDGRIARLVVRDARLRIDAARDGGLSVAGRPLAGGSNGEGGDGGDGASIPAIPLDAIVVEDTALTLSTPQGIATGTARATLAQEGTGFRGQAVLTAPAKGLATAAAWAGAGRVSDAAGKLTAKLRFTWDEGADGVAIQAGGDLLLADVAGSFGPVAASGINGVITLSSLDPPVVAPGQTLAVKLLDVGLPLTDGTIRFGYGRNGRLDVERAEWHWAGGLLRAEPFAIAPAAPKGTVTLRAEGIHLGAMLALVAVDGLEATGTVSGRLPVRIAPNAIHLDEGVLEADRPGALRYDPANPPDFLKGAEGSPTALLMGALTDFRYDTLRATVDGQAGGELALGIAIRGSNPEFYDGYPVALNLKVTGALDRILRQSLDTYRIPDAIRDRMTEFQRKGP